MKDKEKEKHVQEYIDNLGLNDLDADDTEMITNMLCEMRLEDFRHKKELKLKDIGPNQGSAAEFAMYSQNYLFLKHILKLEKQNQEIIEQNKQTLEQNQEIINQNQQIIDLLAKIESKQ